MKNNIKNIRQQRGLTQTQLAQLIGTSKSYISQLESGQRDIRQIRAITMTNLCNALNCSADDLLIKTEFKYNQDGYLIVDGFYLDNRLVNQYIIKINECLYLLPSYVATQRPDKMEKYLKPMMSPLSSKAETVEDYVCAMYHCVPRRGFKIELLRPITKSELSDLKSQYNISNITDEFVSSKGGFYGETAKVCYTAVQISVNGNETLKIEEELRNRGIEACAINSGKINIRIQ